LQIIEICDNVQISTNTIEIPSITDNSIDNNEFGIVPFSSQRLSDHWWDFSVHYNTRPGGFMGDVYWEVAKLDRAPFFIRYFANHGTALMSHSNSFFDEVNQMIGHQRNAITSVGAFIASTVAGIIGGKVTLGVATVIGILIGLGAVATGAVFFVNAWSAARAAERHFDFIASLARPIWDVR
jgi:hypothetical protein